MLGRVNLDLRTFGDIVGVADPRKVLDQTFPCFGVQTLRVPGFADLKRCRDVNLDESSHGGNRMPDGSAGGLVGGDGGTDRDPAGLGHLRGHVPDPPDVQLPVLGRKPQLRREHLPDVIPVKKRHRPSPDLLEAGHEGPGDGRLSCTGQPRKEDREPLSDLRRDLNLQFLDDLRICEPFGDRCSI